MAHIRASPNTVKAVGTGEYHVQRCDVDGLRVLRDSIVTDIREYRLMERAERRAVNSGKSVMHSLVKANLAADHYERKAALRSKIYTQQHCYLCAQAEIEQRIAGIPDHAARLMLSLYFSDLLTHKEAAAYFGGMTDAGVQQIIDRYFAKSQKGRDPP